MLVAKIFRFNILLLISWRISSSNRIFAVLATFFLCTICKQKILCIIDLVILFWEISSMKLKEDDNRNWLYRLICCMLHSYSITRCTLYYSPWFKLVRFKIIHRQNNACFSCLSVVDNLAEFLVSRQSVIAHVFYEMLFFPMFFFS